MTILLANVFIATHVPPLLFHLGQKVNFCFAFFCENFRGEGALTSEAFAKCQWNKTTCDSHCHDMLSVACFACQC